ncbi:MAG: hypothetical protein ABIP93_02080 [Gemmatimonadaceae bacterium]
MHLTFRSSGDAGIAPSLRPPAAARLRAIFGLWALASILMVGAACDNAAETAEIVHHTSLANKPNVIFLLFGDRSDPRLLPVATSIDGQVTPIALDAQEWRDFDHLYLRSGTPVSLYRDGRPDGEATVRRGMWEGSTPLYKLPACRALKPLAAILPRPNETREVMLERIASSEPLTPAPLRAPIAKRTLDSARALALRVSQREGITKKSRAELDLAVSAISTGSTAWPTLVASFMERGGGIQGKPRHLFVLADSGSGGYEPSFVHTAGDSMPEFRRFIDHADITGDGVDELLMEGWKNGGDSYLLFMRYTNGKWVEMARGGTSWCADGEK